MLTEGVDYADAGKSTHDNVADTFKFTDASEKSLLLSPNSAKAIS